MINNLLTLAASVVVFYVFVGRKLLKIKNAAKNATVFEGISDEERITEAVIRLHSAIGRPYSRFYPSQTIIDILKREPDSEYALNLFLQEIAAHCNYNRQRIILRIFPANEHEPPGKILNMGSEFLMELHMNYDNIMAVMAVIVHEFSHFYLESNKLALKDVLANEILTDTAAIYLGFQDIMTEGYKPYITNSEKGQLWHRVGYLDLKGLNTAIDIIQKI